MLNRPVRHLGRSGVAAILALALAPGVAAQGDRIQLRIVPQPDQWVQFRLTLDIAIGRVDAAPGDPAGSATPASPMGSGQMVMAYTQTTGHPDPDGRVKAEVTFDELSGSMTSDGRTAPIAPPSGIAGQVMTTTYDASGKLVDFQFPSAMPEASAAQVRQMMTSIFGGIVPPAIAVGETVTTPVHIALPGTSGAASTMTGANRFTLRSITTDGDRRIAHFDQKMELSMSRDLTTPARNGQPARTITMAMRTTGAGTMDYDVDRGIIVANRIDSTIDTKTTSDSPLPKGAPSLDLHMTMKMTVDATY
jgi:hypothetical protein